MSLSEQFRKAVEVLESARIPYAVAGGFAADLYRQEPRLTMDVDFVIGVESDALGVAVRLLADLGLKAGILRKADLAGGPLFAIKRKTTNPCMVVGRSSDADDMGGVDILLPEIPWVKKAVMRAADHRVDFGFGAVPVLRIEDVILSKLFALQASRPRPKDMDDLISVAASGHPVNIAYLAGQIADLNIQIPPTVKPFIPDDIRMLFPDMRKRRRGAGSRK